MLEKSMQSTIIEGLKAEFETVAVVWSETIPNDALEFTKGRFGCILNLFAKTGAVPSYVLRDEAYTEEKLNDTLPSAGFAEVQKIPSLSGRAISGEADLPVVVARRPGRPS